MDRLATYRLTAHDLVIFFLSIFAVCKFFLYDYEPAERGLFQEGIDFRYTHAAGMAWRSGLDPYRLDQYRRASVLPLEGGYAYAPTAAPLAVALSLPPRTTGVRLLWTLNVLAALLVTTFLAHSMRASLDLPTEWETARLLGGLVVVFMTFSAFSLANLQTGQTSLLALAFLCAAWWSSEAARPVSCGLCAALATFKPSLGMFVYLVLLPRMRKRGLAAFVLAALALASLPLLRRGPIELIRAWLTSMRQYSQVFQNRPECPWSFGVKSQLASRGYGYEFVPLIGVAGFAWTVLRRRSIRPLEMFALCLAWPVLFIQGHHYDLVVLFPLFCAVLIACRRSILALAAASAVIALVTDETGMLPPTVEFYPNGTLVACLAFVLGLVVLIERRRQGGSLLI